MDSTSIHITFQHLPVGDGDTCVAGLFLIRSISYRAMALVDSEAAFEAHCDKIDGSGALKRLFSAKGLKTMSQLAFVCGTPQSPPSETEFATFCTELNNGIALSMSQFAEVRRLHFESSTMVVAHLKTQVSMDGCPDAVRKLPVAEKQARLIAKQARLRGVKITGELQPSYMLIDLVASMVESKSVIWICPSRCSKQEMEIHHTMKSLLQYPLSNISSESLLRTMF